VKPFLLKTYLAIIAVEDIHTLGLFFSLAKEHRDDSFETIDEKY